MCCTPSFTRCLRRDSEARTGALLADREAVRLELSAKEAELDRQKSFTEDIRAKAGVRLADREAVRLELSAKEAELDYQKAFTEGIRAKALVEARSKVRKRGTREGPFNEGSRSWIAFCLLAPIKMVLVVPLVAFSSLHAGVSALSDGNAHHPLDPLHGVKRNTYDIAY